MELKDLVGLHKLSGVDMQSESIEATWGGDFRDSQVIRFILDGVTYSAIEDRNDGYRSAMEEIRKDSGVVKNTFPEQDVFCVYEDMIKGDGYDLLRVLNINTSKEIMVIGTDYSDDYYPSFVCDWNPENMDINKDKLNENNTAR